MERILFEYRNSKGERIKIVEKEAFKLPGNRGPDGIFFSENPDGSVKNIYIIESKYNHSGQFKLNQTKTKGKQMGPEWLDETINQMRKSSNPKVRQTAEFLLENQEKWVLKGNVLDSNGINRWGKPTRAIEKLDQGSIQPRAPPKPGK
jgi:hypothetical protein